MISARTLRWAILGGVVAGLSCGRPIAEPQAGGLEPCVLPEVQEPLRCGVLLVPEVRGGGSGRQIALRVVVLPALTSKPAADPWVELVGGPGNAASDFAASFAGDLRYLRQTRDVLLVDQRGTGASHPLYCEELALHQLTSFVPRFPPAAVAACRARLSAVADLSAYTTAAAAEDLDAVRRWLGYAQLNLFGSSYGTRVALEYMRRFPAQTRSAMLWGVVPPDFRRPRFYPRDGQRALGRLLTECHADSACRGAFPRLASDVADMWARLDHGPIPMTFVHPSTGATVSTTLTRAGVAQALWNALSYPDRGRQLPRIIHRAAAGDFSLLQALDVATRPPRRRYYNGMHLSVVCADEVLHNSPAELTAASVGMFMPADRGLEYLAACQAWGVAPSSADSQRPVTTAVPTLIISGELDPITPPSWGEQVARALPHSRHVVIPALSHESSGVRGAECLDSLFARFVTDPTPSTLDTTCVSRMRAPPFARSASAPR